MIIRQESRSPCGFDIVWNQETGDQDDLLEENGETIYWHSGVRLGFCVSAASRIEDIHSLRASEPQRLTRQ